jgi:integrative and conjugative element protein (TIGR02256 family)
MLPLRRDITQPSPRIVWLAQSAFERMAREASAKAPLETGGILMGYRADGSNEPVITDAIGPGPRAIHERTAFLPDQDYHVRRIAELYCASEYRIFYLGDWHTHPGAKAYLSACDRATLMLIASSKNARAPQPVMLILAPGPTWSPHVWVGRLKKSRVWRTTVFEARCAGVRLFGGERSEDSIP